MIYDNIDLNSLKIFVSVFENNSISIASKKLYISQPAVTISIKKLEERLKGKLFTRLPKGIKPTIEGKKFYEHCKNGLNQIGLGFENFSMELFKQSGTLNIGSDTSIIKYVLAPFIKKFSELYPFVKISFTEVIADRLQKYLSRGDIDIAFEIDTIKNLETFDSVKLRSLTNCFVGNMSIKNVEVNYISLKEKKIATLKNDTNHRNLFNSFCLKNSLLINPFYETANFESLTTICKGTNAIGFAVKELIENDLNELFVLKSTFNLPQVNLYALLPKGNNNSLACEKFLDLFK